MKKIFVCSLIIILSLWSNTNFAKDKRIRMKEVPQLVQNSFNEKYHDAIVKKWMVDNSMYTVLYSLKQNKCKATFSPDGKWINTTSVITWEDLPEAVKSGFNDSRYKDWTLFGYLQIELPNGTKNYALLIDNESPYVYIDLKQEDFYTDTYKIYFSPQGKLIRSIIQYDKNLL